MKMNRLIPMLPVRSIAASIEFYRKLGFSVETRRDDWGWAMLCFGECRLMVDQSINLHRARPANPFSISIRRASWSITGRCEAPGWTIPDLDVTFYGLTEFRLDDPDGNRLWIGQNTSSATQ